MIDYPHRDAWNERAVNPDDWGERPCRWGNCVEWYGLITGEKQSSFGPVGCYCDLSLPGRWWDRLLRLVTLRGGWRRHVALWADDTGVNNSAKEGGWENGG